MQAYITSIARNSIIQSLQNKFNTKSRLMIIVILACIISAHIVAVSSTPLCLDEVECQVLMDQYPLLTPEKYFDLKKTTTNCITPYGALPIRFACAVINNESQWDDFAVSPTGDYGPMQINQRAHYSGKDPKELFDFHRNISIGCPYLAQCYSQAMHVYGKDGIGNAFRFYNAGMNSNIRTYNNWAYVTNILKDISVSEKNMSNKYQSYRNDNSPEVAFLLLKEEMERMPGEIYNSIMEVANRLTARETPDLIIVILP